MYPKRKRTGEEVLIATFKALSQNSLGGTEKNFSSI
jgi:hypothetical protein